MHAFTVWKRTETGYATELVPATFRSGGWNECQQALLGKACKDLPGFNAKLYTTHSLRGGGACAAVDHGGQDLLQVNLMLQHKRLETTQHYLRHSTGRSA